MQALEKRIAALEFRKHSFHQWVWRKLGESENNALLRADFDPHAPVILFCWRDNDAGY